MKSRGKWSKSWLKEAVLGFELKNTIFGLKMHVSESDEETVDELISSHAKCMSETHFLPEVGQILRLEYYVSKYRVQGYNGPQKRFHW